MSTQDFVNPAMVREVSRTATPINLLGWNLTFEQIMRASKLSEWTGCFYEIKPAAAKRIAKAINERQPWQATRHLVPESEIINGEFTDDQPVNPNRVTPLNVARTKREQRRRAG